MKQKSVFIVHNATQAKLVDADKAIRRAVSSILSYKVAGADRMGKTGWDGHSSFYQMRTDQFPSGFVRLVKKRLEKINVRVVVKSKTVPDPIGPENPTVDSFPEDPKYDYQAETMNRLVKMGGMIAQVATGGGKSRIFKLCNERIGRTSLFITTRKSLMYQMSEAYENDLGKTSGILGDGTWRPKADGANFAIVDTLVSRLQLQTVKGEIDKAVDRLSEKAEKEIAIKLSELGLPVNSKVIRNMPPEIEKNIKKVRDFVYNKHMKKQEDLEGHIRKKVESHNKRRQEAIDFLHKVEFLCIEEAHEVSGNGFYDIGMMCKNAYYRLALTATPFMKDDEEANMRLMAVTGIVGIKVSEKLLIDRGILAKPYFRFLPSSSPEGPRGNRLVMAGTPYSRAYSVGISENTKRNIAIAKEVQRAKSYGLTSMLLVQYTKHGKALEKLLTSMGIATRFIHGAHEQKARSASLKDLGEGRLDCLIGSTILDVGVDVPSVGLVGLVGGGKAEVSTRQRIGRGLRSKKSGPNIVFIVDFQDKFNGHLHRHATERQRIIKDTPGFGENIVSDFDYAGLGFTKRT